MPNRVNCAPSRDVAKGERIEGSLADCISGRLHLPSHNAQRVRPAAVAPCARLYTICCVLFTKSVPDLVLKVRHLNARCKDLSDRVSCTLIRIFIHASPGCPRSRSEHRLKAIYGLIQSA